MRQYCVEVVNMNLRNQPVHLVGPFLDVDSAELWINENKDGWYKGRQFRIKQMTDVTDVHRSRKTR